MGGVRKGETGTRVVWQSKLTIKGKGETTDPSETGNDAEGGRSVWCVRHYTVFHVSQCDGIALRSVEVPGSTVDPIGHAEDLAAAYLAQQGIKVSVGGSRACYSPAEDRIRMPERDAFDDAPRYYSTLFHEIGHSTGHATRLARKGVTDPAMFGSHTYAQEELVAEFAATFVMGGLGIARPDVEEQSAAYLKSWAAKLRDDPKVLPIAAAQAQKAADLVFAALGEVEGEESEEGEGETAAA
jgi:antirestriction protein ArdC